MWLANRADGGDIVTEIAVAEAVVTTPAVRFGRTL